MNLSIKTTKSRFSDVNLMKHNKKNKIITDDNKHNKNSDHQPWADWTTAQSLPPSYLKLITLINIQGNIHKSDFITLQLQDTYIDTK